MSENTTINETPPGPAGEDHVDAAPEAPAPAGSGSPPGPGVLPSDTMAEASRKTLRHQFNQMLEHVEGTRQGDDPEELHDMRVAVRRLRSAFRTFENQLDDDRTGSFRKELRRAGRALGRVRDLDVFLARAEGFRHTLSDDARPGMDGFMESVLAARAAARSTLVDYLDGKRYRRFAADFDAFLDKPLKPVRYPSSSQPLPHRVRHALPVILTSRLADVRAHEEWINGHDDPLERLHRLRISLKRLRYSLEFFEEVLSPVTAELIEELKNEQDHLGALHDAHVATGLIQRYLATGAVEDGGGGAGPVMSETVTEFLGATHREGQHYLDHFPDLWERLRSSEFRRAMLGAAQDLL